MVPVHIYDFSIEFNQCKDGDILLPRFQSVTRQMLDLFHHSRIKHWSICMIMLRPDRTLSLQHRDRAISPQNHTVF